MGNISPKKSKNNNSENNTDDTQFTLTVAGYDECSSFQQASAQACGIAFSFPDKYKESKILSFTNRQEYHEWLEKNKVEFGKEALQHKTCPFIFLEPGKIYIGGFDEFLQYSKKKTM